MRQMIRDGADEFVLRRVGGMVKKMISRIALSL